jgi:hypothetical protein
MEQVGTAYGIGGHGLWNRWAWLMEQVGMVYGTGGTAYGTGGHGLWNFGRDYGTDWAWLGNSWAWLGNRLA